MRFFAHQRRALRRSAWLIALYLLVVAMVVALADALLLLAWAVYAGEVATLQQLQQLAWLDTRRGLLLALAVSAMLLLACWWRYRQLRVGGRQVAEEMGGQLLRADTRKAEERQLLNLVAEMAIASGLPIPPVYVLDEPGINAFAAGYQAEDAVIGISRGCLHYLNREECQGVIAHEFSHIRHGDIRINLLLSSWLFGLTAMSNLGRMLSFGGGKRSVLGRRTSSRTVTLPVRWLWLVILGYGLRCIGALGSASAAVIQAGLNRQREYLADARAVQFTRYPQGVANALKKIGGLGYGSHMQKATSQEFSHYFFARLQVGRFTPGLWRSHPPLRQRIRRITPAWNGRYPRVEVAAADRIRDDALQKPPQPVTEVAPRFDSWVSPALLMLTALPQRGAMPAPLEQALEDGYGARAVVYALLVAWMPAAVQKRQRQMLQMHADRAVYDISWSLLPLLQPQPRMIRILLLELALPVLKSLTAAQYRRFIQVVQRLVQIDQQVDLFEWTLIHWMDLELRPCFAPRARQHRPRSISMRDYQNGAYTLLHYLASLDADRAESALQAACSVLHLPLRTVANSPDLKAWQKSVRMLAHCTEDERRKLMCAVAAMLPQQPPKAGDDWQQWEAARMLALCWRIAWPA